MSTGPLPRRARRISYTAARRLSLATGLLILAVLASVLYLTRVDTIEVVAVLFYLPVFVAFMTRGVPGGLVAGAAAAAAYVAIRYPSLNAIRGGDLVTLLVGRALGYLAFGAIGGWAASLLQGSILKLNLFDTVDDSTGLLNARQLGIEARRQFERSRRYGSLFSMATTEIENSVLSGSRRRVRSQMAELGRAVKATIRQVDVAAHSTDGVVHRVVVLLPDTGPEGAAVFAARLEGSLSGHLYLGQAASAPRVSPLSYPEDEVQIQAVLARLHADDIRDNGEHEGLSS
ncbi:MAG: nucleotidyl cyclase domain-containing protein [Acidimicrobiales bacterium]